MFTKSQAYIMEFKDNLKKIFDERNLSASKISASTGIPRSNIEKWLGGSNPNLKQVQELATFLGMSLDELISGKKKSELLDEFLNKVEIHSGLYELNIKKVKRK